MVLPHSTGDLYHKYRPRKFGEIAGHKELVSSIQQAVISDSPSQAYLLVGDSGTGKTTTARIMAMSLNCENRADDGEPCLVCGTCKTIVSGNCIDLVELNAADNRGIGDIRAICRTMPLLPMQLDKKVYILDEAHQLTNEAQSSLLKVLEEAPAHVFIILCSTHPKKILPTVRNRCQKYVFSSLRRSEMVGLLEEITVLEGEDLPRAAYEAITDATGGSPRAAIVQLQQVLQLGSKSLPEIMRIVGGEEAADKNVIQLCFALNSKAPWSKVVETFNEVKHMGAPAIGMVAAGFFRNQLLKAKGDQIHTVAAKLEMFLIPFVDGKLGENQLVHALYRAKHGK